MCDWVEQHWGWDTQKGLTNAASYVVLPRELGSQFGLLHKHTARLESLLQKSSGGPLEKRLHKEW